MRIKEFLKHIDSFAPFDLAEEWDNPGLLVGSYEAEVKRVGICLDAVHEAVMAAHENGCEVLLTHHPLIFRPLKKIDIDSEPGRTISEAIKCNISIIAAHTNWDRAKGGVNDALAELLGLKDIEILNSDSGFGVYGSLPEVMELRKFLEHVKSSWQLSHLDLYADSGKMPEKISCVALCGGSGAEFWRDALENKADIYITADMKYHEIIDANRAGLAIAVINHGEMERASLSRLAEKVSCTGLEAVMLDVNALNVPLRI